jgi:hypothetical protein
MLISKRLKPRVSKTDRDLVTLFGFRRLQIIDLPITLLRCESRGVFPRGY